MDMAILCITTTEMTFITLPDFTDQNQITAHGKEVGVGKNTKFFGITGHFRIWL